MSDSPVPPRRDPSAPPPVAPVRRSTLISAAVLGALVGWSLAVLSARFGWVAPQVPVLVPVGLLLLAALLGVLARRTHQQVQVRHEPIDSRRAVLLLASAQSAALGGAALVGGYLAYLIHFLPDRAAPAALERVVNSGLAAVFGAALVVSGLLLERACRVPPGDDDEEPTPGAG